MGYQQITTLGSSKGGTAALYFGLEHHVDVIYSAACQYYVGDYLAHPQRRDIFTSMMGNTAGNNDIDTLNRMLPEQIEHHSGSHTKVHLFYSDQEHTYQEHTVHLLKQLEACHINTTKTVVGFKDHNEVGKPFIAFLHKTLEFK